MPDIAGPAAASWLAETILEALRASDAASETDLQFLKDEMCDEVQGYLLGRPAAIGSFRRYTHGDAASEADVDLVPRAESA